MKEEVLQLLDITGAEHVEVLIRDDRKVIWVNVNGICRLRVCQIETLVVNDERFPGE
jgi:hypothetical protein